MATDTSFESTLRELRLMTIGGGQTPPPLPPTDFHPGDDPEMEARLKRLEDDVRVINGDLKVLLGDIRELKGQVGALERAVVSKIPTGWSFFAIIVSAIGLTLAAIVAAPALTRLLASS